MNIKTIIAALAISLAPALSFAQSLEAHKAQSDNLDKKIDIVEAEIKTLKAKKKAEPSVIAHTSNLASKQAELKELKRQKKIIDGAIKAQKKANEEAKEAQKATSKHENATQDVKQMQEQKAKEKEKENN